MAGNPRGTKARKFGSSGGGGNLLANLGMGLFGMPEITGGMPLSGEEMAAMGGPEAVIGADAPAIEPLRVEKPGFWQNFASKGAAGKNYAALDSQIKMGNHENALRQELIRRQLQGQRGNIQLKDQLEGVAREDAYKKELDAADIKDAIQRGLGRNTSLRDQHVIPNTIATLTGGTFKQNLENEAYQTPDMQTAHVQNMYANLQKQGLENDKTKATTEGIRIENPTKAYMGVGPRTMVNPVTGQSYRDVEPMFEEPIPGGEGGLKNFNVGGHAGFSEKPGGILGETATTFPTTSAQAAPQPVAPQQNQQQAFTPEILQPIKVPEFKEFNPALMFKNAASGLKNILMGEPVPEVPRDPFAAPHPTQTPQQPQQFLNSPLIPFRQTPESSVLKKFQLMMKMRGVPGF
jgi:hypothetical protein